MSTTTCRRCQALYKTWADAWDVLQSLPLAQESEDQVQLLHEMWTGFKEHVLFCSVVASLDLRTQYLQAVETTFQDKKQRRKAVPERWEQGDARTHRRA